MMPAAKHGDPQIGVDIHLCVVPPSPRGPLPTPHTSIVLTRSITFPSWKQ